MTWTEWRSFWRFDHEIDVPHLSIVAMCPYGFVRILWYATSKEFKAWPNTWETGVVIGWRWPFAKKFREKSWNRQDPMLMAIYSAMDEICMIRLAEEFQGTVSDPASALFHPQSWFNNKAALTIREINESEACPHDEPGKPRYWIASCPSCARKALRKALELRGQYENTLDRQIGRGE